MRVEEREREKGEENNQQLERKEITLDVLLSSQGKVSSVRNIQCVQCLDMRDKRDIDLQRERERARRFH